MKKEYLYYGIIALGVVVPAIYFLGLSGSGKNLVPPGALEEKVLHGESTDQRIEAAKGLIQHGPAARKEIRRALAGSRQNDAEVRILLLQAVASIEDWRSLPEIFVAMEDPDKAIRGRAGAAARVIMGMHVQFRADDPPEKRAKDLEIIRDEYKAMVPRYPKYYRGQEE
jgi:hypothetical protein